MDDLIKRLEATSAARAKATAHDDPNNYLLVIARLSHEDARLMAEAAAALAEAQATIARLEGALREIIDASNNTGIEMGTVGMRVAERVEDIARAALSPREGERVMLAPKMAVYSEEDGMESAGGFTPIEGPVEYIRMDDYAATIARLREAIQAILDDVGYNFEDLGEHAREKVMAAL